MVYDMPMYPDSLALLHFETVTVREILTMLWRESQKGQGYMGFFVNVRIYVLVINFIDQGKVRRKATCASDKRPEWEATEYEPSRYHMVRGIQNPSRTSHLSSSSAHSE